MMKFYAAFVKSNITNFNQPISSIAQHLSGIKSVINDAVNLAFHSKTIDDNGRVSIVIYDLKENHEDLLKPMIL